MNICTCIYDINFRYTYIYIYTLEIFGKLKELTTCNLYRHSLHLDHWKTERESKLSTHTHTDCSVCHDITVHQACG